MDLTFVGKIDHPIDAVWDVLSDFAGLPAWHPGLVTCDADGSEVGSVRRVTLKDGRGATETLDILDEDRHVLGYSVTESVRPETIGLSATITLTAADDDSTQLEWVVSPPESHGLTDNVLDGMRAYYPTRIQNLAAEVGRRAAQTDSYPLDRTHGDLMEQLGSSTDRLAIQELNQRYAVHIDLKQVDEWAALFVDDVLFDEQEFGTPPFHSRDEVRAYGQFLAENVRYALHHMTTHAIFDLTESSARGVAFAVVEAMLNNGDHARHQVTYHDRYVKIDGQWLFSERVLKSSLPSESFAISP